VPQWPRIQPGGSGAVLLAKTPAAVEVWNDIDGALVNLYRVLRDPEQSRKLKESLEHTPCAREEFEAAELTSDDPVEAARRFVVHHRQSHGGLHSAGVTASPTLTGEPPVWFGDGKLASNGWWR